ncbi:two-component hybrid sensor and regulator [Minicystis rosea]|nr:two-component hybrid sensor and regulator [Minicystis rosea]
MVWLVEDGPPAAAPLRSLAQYDVDVIADDESVLDRLARGSAPDVLIVGQERPGTRAAEVCRRVRAGRDLLSLPILALVAQPTRRAIVEILEAGANDCLGAPCDEAELRTRVSILAQLRRGREALEAELSRLEIATESSGVGTWDFYPQSGKLYWDGRVKELLGVRPETNGTYELFLAAVHPDDREATHEAVQRAIGKGGTGQYRIQCRLLGVEDRIERWIASQGRAFFEGGRATRFIGTCVDITEQKRAERALDLLARAGAVLTEGTACEARVRAAAALCVEDLADFCIVDLLEDTDHLARAAVTHVDPTKEEALRALREMHPPDPARHPAFEVVRTGTSWITSELDPTLIEAHTSSAEERMQIRALAIGSVIIVPLATRARKLGTLSLGRHRGRMPFDRADLRVAEELARRAATAFENARLHEAESRARAAAEAASRAKDQFLATVSHELRTPLTAVLGWVRMMISGAVPPDRQPRALETIQRNARAQAQLVEALLDFSSIVAGRLHLEITRVRAAKVIEAALESIAPAADTKGVILAPSIDPEMGEILGDSARIQQIVGNLLSNAVKFTPSGGRVTVTAKRAGSVIELVVADTGVGMDAEFLPRAFEHFQQADSSATRAYGGLGLGLAIVKHLVAQHGGRVEAQSDGLGKGSTFTVRLPIAPEIGPA